MNGWLLVCLGSVLAGLLGLLALLWAARQARWRWLWLLVAGGLLVTAGFGAAEAVYELNVERQEPDAGSRSEEPALAAWPTPLPTLPPTAPPPPTPSPRPSPTPWPTWTVPPTPTFVATPTEAATATATSPPPPTVTPTPPAPVENPGDLGAQAAALIPAERAILARLDDPPQYLLDVVVDWEALTVAGTAEIRYTNDAGVPLEVLYLRLYPNAEHYEEGETRVDSVLVDGGPAGFEVTGTVLEVQLTRPLAPEAQTTLQIPFTVQVPRRPDRFGYDEGIMSLGHWYPMLAVYDDEGWNLDPYVFLGDAFYSQVGLFTVRVTVPDGTAVAATGVESGRLLLCEGYTTLTFVSGATRDFALALSRDYQTISTQLGDTTVTAYYLPGDEAGAQEALQVAADSVEVYNRRFGTYPYTELDVAETAFAIDGSPGGMEFPGIVFISSEFYDPLSWVRGELDVVVAHEVAHQWWYGVVGNNQVDEPWLDESFATFASLVYVQEAQGEAAYGTDAMMQVFFPYQMAAVLGADGPIESSLLDYEDDWLTYQSIVYSKGALFLMELRQMLGDELFFQVLQHHFESHKYGILAPDDFRQSLQEVTGDQAALAFYDDVVVGGAPIEGTAGLEGLGDLDGLLDEELTLDEIELLLELLEDMLGP